MYNKKVILEVKEWKSKMTKPAGLFNNFSKKVQNKVNNLIPEKIHTVITESIKKITQIALFGSEYTTNKPLCDVISFEERESKVFELLEGYRKTAAVEGAGTGAAGFVGSAADFPLLLGIKMKFLFQTASLYGYDVKQYEERLFILHIFQLAFSSDERRIEILRTIENWDSEKEKIKEIDWKVFQQEYRDYIDLVKLLQMVPGLGAAFGAYANYNLVDELGKTAMNAYRVRQFPELQNQN